MEKDTRTIEQKEYDSFINKQFGILGEHFKRCMLRCSNEYHKLFIPKKEKYAFDDQDRPVEINSSNDTITHRD